MEEEIQDIPDQNEIESSNNDVNNIIENCQSKSETKENNNDDPNEEKINEDEINKSKHLIEMSDLTMENIFYELYQLIIQNAKSLIIDFQALLFRNYYCPGSDIVTIMYSLYEMSRNPTNYEEESGFCTESINYIYKHLEEKFNANGSDLITSAFHHLENLNKEMLCLVDSFIKNDILNNNIHMKKSQAKFDRVIGAKTEKYPILIYKIKSENANNDKSLIVEFSKRPGIFYLDSPRNIIILSQNQEENENLSHGILLHRDINFDDDDFGIICYQISSTSFNYFFFKYLFEAYWSDRSLQEDFIEIYNTKYPEDKMSSIFHVTKCDGCCFLNYCPRNKTIQELAKKIIEKCFLLLPSFPNSIIIKNENPLCVIDFYGGNLNEYLNKIYIIDEKDEQNIPIPYPINKTTLDFAVYYCHKLVKINPQIRFSITGENFYYKEYQKREIESKFSNPNISENIQSVFDPCHPSHIVLCVDNNFPFRPTNVTPLSWLPKSENTKPIVKNENINNSINNSDEIYDTNDNQRILNISNQIINDLGNIEQSADTFFITLSGGFPTVSKGSIPEYIHGLVGYSPSDGNSIKGGMYHLIKHFSKGFVKNQILYEPIPLDEISSTDHWINHPNNEEAINHLLKQISFLIQNHFQIKEENINTHFIGKSMIVMHIKGLSENLVRHQIIKNAWHDDYQPCEADEKIKKILNDVQNVNLQVTDVIHEKSIRVSVFHKKEFGMNKDEFIKNVKKISNKFGFMKLSVSKYHENIENNDIIGYVNVELIGTLTSMAISSMLNDELLNIKYEINTSSTQSNNIDDAFPNGKVDIIRQIFAMNNNGQIKDNKTNIIIIPSSNDALKHESLQSVPNPNENSTCLQLCDDQQTYLPQCIYKYKFGSVSLKAICRGCIIDTFQNMENFHISINQETKMIDRNEITKIYDILPNFIFVEKSFWDIFLGVKIKMPFGQVIWSLIISDDLISHYIKLWFTINMNIIIRTSPYYFICCPRHPDVIYNTPKDDNLCICPKCNWFYHSKCNFWHRIDDECPSIEEDKKRCPYCHVIAEKISGCSHIRCRCGKHWCFQCEHSPIFETASQCYLHMSIVHNESFYFTRKIIHIYLNEQNENEIVNLEEETVKIHYYIPSDEKLIIHDHQDGSKLQICSYDKINWDYKDSLDNPLIIENVYDYDIIIGVDEVKSVFDDDSLKKTLCDYFYYSVLQQQQ